MPQAVLTCLQALKAWNAELTAAAIDLCQSIAQVSALPYLPASLALLHLSACYSQEQLNKYGGYLVRLTEGLTLVVS